MRSPLIITTAVLLGLFLAPQLPGASEDAPDVRELVKRVDRLYRSSSSYGELEMIVDTPHWSRTMRMRLWTEGMEKTFIYITHPRRETGTSMLRIGTEMWNYLPKINKVMKVPPSMMMNSWMGSDFTNDDLVKESSLLRDYDARFVVPEDAEPGLFYVELTPREDSPIVWGRILTTIQKDDNIVVSMVYYDEKGRKMRVLRFSEITDFGDRRIPAVMEMTPLSKEGHRTVIRYKKAEFDLKIRPGTFTLRNLQKRR
jgi:outer membrane lipoprotein-sorting protein